MTESFMFLGIHILKDVKSTYHSDIYTSVLLQKYLQYPGCPISVHVNHRVHGQI